MPGQPRGGGGDTLVEAPPEHVCAAGHLPGAVNIRPRRVAELASRLLPDLGVRMVVYSDTATCDVCLRVATGLRDLGYFDVARYTAGKQDRIAAGPPIRTSEAPADPPQP